MNVAQKVAYNTAAQIAGRVVVLGIGLVTLRLTATYLGVHGFGRLSIIIALTGLVATIGDLGVTTTLAREVVKDPAKAAHFGGQLLGFRIATSFGAAALLLALVPALPYDHRTKVALSVALVGMIFTIVGTFPSAFFQANLRLDYAAALDVLLKLLGLATILTVRSLDLGLYGLVSILAAVNAAVCLLGFVLSRRFWSVNVQTDIRRALPLVRDAIAVGLVSTIGLLHFRGDAILLSLLKPARDVGIYAIAYRFVDQAFVLPGVFMGTMFPILTHALHTDKARAAAAINRTFQVLALTSIVVALGMFTLAEPLVHLVAGSGFGKSVRPMRILAFSLPFIFVGPVFYNVLIAINKQRQLILVSLLSLALNIVMNLFLIPRYSFNGAASATVASEAFSLAACYFVARRQYRFELDRLFLGRAGAAVGASVLVFAALHSQSAWIGWVSAEVVFIACAYAFKAVTRTDLARMFQRSAPPFGV